MPSEPIPNERERQAWADIRDNILLAHSFVRDMDLSTFAADQKTIYAVTRCLEIISEASRRLRGPQQEACPDIEWRQIEASGNVFRHEYQKVGEDQVWLTVQTRLPDLLAAAERALRTGQ